jgi:hypothetical protein
LEIKKVPKETFLILTFSDAHVIGKLLPAALLRARASHIATYRVIYLMGSALYSRSAAARRRYFGLFF